MVAWAPNAAHTDAEKEAEEGAAREAQEEQDGRDGAGETTERQGKVGQSHKNGKRHKGDITAKAVETKVKGTKMVLVRIYRQFMSLPTLYR